MARNLLPESLEDQLAALGAQGVDKLRDLVADKVAESAGWEKIVYTLVGDAVRDFGPIGVNKALNALHDLLEGKVDAHNFLDLEAASDLLVQLQNDEADGMEAGKAFLIQVGAIIKDIATGVITALV